MIIITIIHLHVLCQIYVVHLQSCSREHTASKAAQIEYIAQYSIPNPNFLSTNQKHSLSETTINPLPVLIIIITIIVVDITAQTM